IALDVLPGNGSAGLVPGVSAERNAGQYLWDVTINSSSTGFDGFKPKGALDPLRPALFLPDALDNSKWQGGFDAGWADLDKTHTYSFVRNSIWTSYINRSVVPESQLSKLDQLWDPRWKGKITMIDPRIPSNGS